MSYTSPGAARIESELGSVPTDLRQFTTERFLFLCFTNRCGSTYFAQLVNSTNQLAYPGEYFVADTILARAKSESLRSLEHYISTMPSQNNWIASKLSLSQLLILARTGILAAIVSRADFIVLERNDKIAQAISRLFAFHRNLWTSDQPQAPAPYPRYSRTAIAQQLETIAAETYGFYAFFAGNDLAPLHLAHETIIASPHAAMTQLGNHLAVPPLHPSPQSIALRQQSDQQNALWKTLYQSGR